MRITMFIFAIFIWISLFLLLFTENILNINLSHSVVDIIVVGGIFGSLYLIYEGVKS